MNDALRDAKSLEAPSWVSARTKAQVVRNLWLAFDYEIQQISRNSFIKCYNDVNSSTMTSEWCHKMSQITMSWFMASWIYRNDRARRRWSGRLEQSGDADLGPMWSREHQIAPVYCMLMKFMAHGESMDATWCHCSWNSMGQWKDLHAMLPNSTTLYDGCASEGSLGLFSGEMDSGRATKH